MNQKRKLLFPFLDTRISFGTIQYKILVQLRTNIKHLLGRLRTNLKTIFKLNLGPTYNQLRTAWCPTREHVRLYAIYSVVPLFRQMFNNARYQTCITAVCFIKETTPFQGSIQDHCNTNLGSYQDPTYNQLMVRANLT